MFKSLLNNENFLDGAFVGNQKAYASFNMPAPLTSYPYHTPSYSVANLEDMMGALVLLDCYSIADLRPEFILYSH